jgi:hypothetical protein
VCEYESSFYLYARDNSAYSSQLNYSSEDSYLHYCYAINGNANYRTCIHFYNNKQKCVESNIVNNSQNDSGYGTMLAGIFLKIVTVNKCCLIKNNEKGNGIYIFFVNAGTMEVQECTIQSGYSIRGNVTTVYSNIEIKFEKETEGLKFCAANVIIYNQLKCRCSDWDIVLLHKIHLVWTILKYIKLVCYNNILIIYTIIMCNIYILNCIIT